MKANNFNEEDIFENINPLVKESMSSEQIRETKRLIKLALPKANKKIININFDFWFFRIFYITFYLGTEKRVKQRGLKSSIIHIILMIISTLFVIGCVLSLVFAIFLAFYYLKSLIGIDIFDFHLLR